MRPKKLFSIPIICLLCLSSKGKAQQITEFHSLKEVLDFAKTKNYTFKNAETQNKLARLTYKTAIGNAINPRIPSSIQAIDNTKLQISFLPGEAFGMPKGSFKEITLGQKYNTNINIQPQLDLLNVANIAQIRSAKINTALVENQNKINERAIYEKINAIYFNILSSVAQKEIIIENIDCAKKTLEIVEKKYNEGILRKQELNDASVNLIIFQDKLEQIDLNIQAQYSNLNLLLETQNKIHLSESIWVYEKADTVIQNNFMLEKENSLLQIKLAEQDYKVLKLQNIPTLSFISSFNWQNLNAQNFIASNSAWSNFNYLGLKLSWDLPTTVQKLAAIKNKQLQIEILKNNKQHIEIESDNTKKQLTIDYEKALKQAKNLLKIYLLKQDSYNKNYNQFKENILPLDRLIASQNEMANSKLNLVVAYANIGFNKNEIEINNIH